MDNITEQKTYYEVINYLIELVSSDDVNKKGKGLDAQLKASFCEALKEGKTVTFAKIKDLVEELNYQDPSLLTDDFKKKLEFLGIEIYEKPEIQIIESTDEILADSDRCFFHTEV